ncbi:MAG: MFS transporter, partial [Chloroflexi bacterium]|nr:MFS transporter [Chloroflexota bacterium]
TIGWLAYHMTESPLHVAAILGTRSAPLMLAPLTGVLADRVDRRQLLLINQSLVATLVLSFSVLLFLGREQVWHLYLFSLLFGLLWAVNNPVRQALVANSVPREALMNATARNSVAFNTMRTIGPMVGGLVIALVGPALNFLIQGVLFGMVILMMIPFRIEYGGNADNARRASPLRNLAEGFRYVASHPQTRMIISMTFVVTVTMLGMVFNMLPAFVPEVLGDTDGDVLGILLAMLGVGGFLGTMTIARFSQFKHKGIQTLAGIAGAAIAVVALSQTSTVLSAAFWLACYQFFAQIVLTTNMTMVQTMTPDHLRGRVVGVYQMEIGLMPVGGLIAGLIASRYGVASAFLVSGIAALTLVALLATFSPTIRKLRL